MTDWNLIIQGNISLIWLQKCLENENNNIPLDKLLKDYKENNENIQLINPGVLMMAAYLLFLYPKESEIIKSDYNDIDFNIFKVHIKGVKRTEESEKQYFTRRIRNSIAHSSWHIQGNNIVFKDENYKNQKNKNEFSIEIELPKFGEFINSFMLSLKNNYYSQRN